jgi:hypothetical protein
MRGWARVTSVSVVSTGVVLVLAQASALGAHQNELFFPSDVTFNRLRVLMALLQTPKF